MKKIVFIIFAFLATTTLSAQQLTQQMFGLHFGNIRTLTQRVDGVPGKSVIKFYKDGRVSETRQNGVKMVYDWDSDGSRIILRAYVDDEFEGEQTIYIEEMSSYKYKYSINGIECLTEFNSNGSLSRTKFTANGQNQITNYYYESSYDTIPYKFVVTMNGQSMSVTMDIIDSDIHGNPTKILQSANGQSMVTNNEIEYY